MDLRGVPCPRNTSLALIKLATMDIGAQLELLLDDGEPILNVPASLELEGYKLILREQVDGTHWRLQVKVDQ